jgi:hypothetical protein
MEKNVSYVHVWEDVYEILRDGQAMDINMYSHFWSRAMSQHWYHSEI